MKHLKLWKKSRNWRYTRHQKNKAICTIRFELSCPNYNNTSAFKGQVWSIYTFVRWKTWDNIGRHGKAAEIRRRYIFWRVVKHVSHLLLRLPFQFVKRVNLVTDELLWQFLLVIINISCWCIWKTVVQMLSINMNLQN